MKYEFLSYEAFPEDQYVKEIVTVMIDDALILPYQHVKMKDGGSFWTFPGSQAQKNGVKKRVNAEFESKRAKIQFENDLEAFLAKKSGMVTSGQTQNDIATTGTETTFLPASSIGGVPANGELPF